MPDHTFDARGRQPTRPTWRRSAGPVIVLILLVSSAITSILGPLLGAEALEHAGIAALGLVAGIHALRCFWNAWRSGPRAAAHGRHDARGSEDRTR